MRRLLATALVLASVFVTSAVAQAGDPPEIAFIPQPAFVEADVQPRDRLLTPGEVAVLQ